MLKSANSVKLILFFPAFLVLLLLNGCAAQKQPDIHDPGSRAWMERIDQIAGLHGIPDGEADIGSQQWMQVMSEEFGVNDGQGHGPDLGSTEWRDAMHRKVFGSPQDIIVFTTYI